MNRWILLLMFSCAGLTVAFSQDRDYGRSMVVTDRGVVAISHVLASQAGAQILSQGGSAIDAAIAANAVLGVTEPMMNGIGGDLFLLYWDAKSGKLYGQAGDLAEFSPARIRTRSLTRPNGLVQEQLKGV